MYVVYYMTVYSWKYWTWDTAKDNSSLLDLRTVNWMFDIVMRSLCVFWESVKKQGLPLFTYIKYNP